MCPLFLLRGYSEGEELLNWRFPSKHTAAPRAPRAELYRHTRAGAAPRWSAASGRYHQRKDTPCCGTPPWSMVIIVGWYDAEGRPPVSIRLTHLQAPPTTGTPRVEKKGVADRPYPRAAAPSGRAPTLASSHWAAAAAAATTAKPPPPTPEGRRWHTGACVALLPFFALAVDVAQHKSAREGNRERGPKGHEGTGWRGGGRVTH